RGKGDKLAACAYAVDYAPAHLWPLVNVPTLGILARSEKNSPSPHRSGPMPSAPVLETSLASLPRRQGKVRDVYDLGEQLLLVATDRISAFDWVLPTGVPDKGRVLTQISRFWFARLNVPHHLLSLDPTDVPLPQGVDVAALEGRSMVVRKTSVVPIECVVRGYLAGSGWKEYRQSKTVCGLQLPDGLQECSQLPEQIFTPATKEESGHDQNISFEEMTRLVGADLSNRLRELS